MSKTSRESDGTVRALRTQGVAHSIGISERAAQRLIATGELPSIKLGKIRLVRIEAIDKFLASRESGAES